jgi:hypothetical protein
MLMNYNEGILHHKCVKYGYSILLSNLIIKRTREFIEDRNLGDLSKFLKSEGNVIVMDCIGWGETDEGSTFWSDVHNSRITDITAICYEYIGKAYDD